MLTRMSGRDPPARKQFEGTIRPASEADSPRIGEIYNDAVRTTVATFDTEPRSAAEQTAWWRHHGERYPVLVAVDQDAIVGWAALSPWSERPAYAATAEDSVYVDATFRGQGIGRALLGALLEPAGSSGFHTLLARVAEGNPASLSLHAAFGFREVGVMREVGFKFGRWVDVHLLQWVLEPAGGPAHRPRG
jgi:phosphinothricin acetyltransferase